MALVEVFEVPNELFPFVVRKLFGRGIVFFRDLAQSFGVGNISVGKDCVNLFSLGDRIEEKIGFAVFFADLDHFGVIIRGKNYSASLLAGNAEPRLAAARSFVVKPRVLAADVAKIALAELADDLAKPARIEMRASVILAQGKMRNLAADAFLYLLAVAAAERGIFAPCRLVDVDLPADAAAVAAAVGDAAKVEIII